MSLKMQHRQRDDKWRAWTTISDGWLTNWLTAEEMRLYLICRAKERFKLEAIEIAMGFPDSYSDMDGQRISSPSSDYHEWYMSILQDPYTYEEKIDAKFKEVTEGLE